MNNQFLHINLLSLAFKNLNAADLDTNLLDRQGNFALQYMTIQILKQAIVKLYQVPLGRADLDT